MTTLLHIDSSPRPEGSVTRTIGAEIVAHLKADRVIYRDLVTALPAIDEAWIGASFTPEDARSEEQTQTLALSEELLAEIEAADVLVIGAPMYNFSVSLNLKSWIDQISRAGRAFRYTETGPEGLLTGKRAIVVAATGGTPAGSDYDFGSRYLTQVLNFVGITDVTVVPADQVDASVEEKLTAARATFDSLAA